MGDEKTRLMFTDIAGMHPPDFFFFLLMLSVSKVGSISPIFVHGLIRQFNGAARF